MVQLAPKQKIIEFLNKEFSKIKAQRLQQQDNKKLKTKAIEKQVRKLLRDIESLSGIFPAACGVIWRNEQIYT